MLTDFAKGTYVDPAKSDCTSTSSSCCTHHHSDHTPGTLLPPHHVRSTDQRRQSHRAPSVPALEWARFLDSQESPAYIVCSFSPPPPINSFKPSALHLHQLSPVAFQTPVRTIITFTNKLSAILQITSKLMISLALQRTYSMDGRPRTSLMEMRLQKLDPRNQKQPAT